MRRTLGDDLLLIKNVLRLTDSYISQNNFMAHQASSTDHAKGDLDACLVTHRIGDASALCIRSHYRAWSGSGRSTCHGLIGHVRREVVVKVDLIGSFLWHVMSCVNLADSRKELELFVHSVGSA